MARSITCDSPLCCLPFTESSAVSDQICRCVQGGRLPWDFLKALLQARAPFLLEAKCVGPSPAHSGNLVAVPPLLGERCWHPCGMSFFDAAEAEVIVVIDSDEEEDREAAAAAAQAPIGNPAAAAQVRTGRRRTGGWQLPGHRLLLEARARAGPRAMLNGTLPGGGCRPSGPAAGQRGRCDHALLLDLMGDDGPAARRRGASSRSRMMWWT